VRPWLSRSGLRAFLLVLPGTAFVLLLLLVPLATVVAWSVSSGSPGERTLAHYRHLFERPVYLHVLANTFRSSAVITGLALLLGYPVAYVLTRLSPTARNVAMVMILIPFWTSLLVRTYAWTVILQRNGPVNQLLMRLGVIHEPLRLVHSTAGVLIGMTHILLPFMIFPLYSVMSRIDLNLCKAAQNLGAGPLRTFRRVFLPLSGPGVAVGCLLVFILSIGYFITPALLGGLGDTFIAQLIEEQMMTLVDWRFAAALAVVLVSVVGSLLAAYHLVFGLDRIGGDA
jgi:ABC-type spermidine/putrescine transport system permease subunit I